MNSPVYLHGANDGIEVFLPIVIAVLFFAAGWLGAANRWRAKVIAAQRNRERREQ